MECLVHSPASETEYSGTLWMKTSGWQSALGGTDMNNVANRNGAMSILYQRTPEPRIAFEVRKAQIVNTVEPFNSNAEVNYAGLS